MKKLLAIIVLGLLWSGSANAAAKKVYKSLVGTAWSFSYSDDKILVSFFEKNNCEVKITRVGSKMFIRSAGKCSWTYSNDSLSVNFGNFNYEANIGNSKNKIIGTVVNKPIGINENFNGLLINSSFWFADKGQYDTTKSLDVRYYNFCLTRNNTWGYIKPIRYKCSLNEDSVSYAEFVTNFLYNNKSRDPSYVLNVLYGEFQNANLDRYLVDEIIIKNLSLRKYLYLVKKENTLITQKKPIIKPSTQPKKIKDVKKEPKQEEFIPKKTNQDNEAPVIEIAEAITVDSQAYTLKGKVKDESKQIYLRIDGRPVEVKRGKFTLDRFNLDPKTVENIKIIAIDKWNNRSEKTIKVTVKLKENKVAQRYEELKPNKVKVSQDDNKIAIIIGIEKYENLINIDAKFANNDANAFRVYAQRALGIKSSNIKTLVNKKATRSQALKAFKLWLPKMAGEGKDIYIFFAGHGLASDNGKDLYILPQDGEAALLKDTAISRVELISLIQKVNPQSVTMFFDTCYSGQTRDEQMLVASLRPIRIIADEQDTPNNFTIFTASNFDQTSGSIEEAKHGMFSYYLMKGLEGKADNNKDNQITNGELIAYLKTNVGNEAFTQNREQDPMLSGNPDQVLMKY